MWRHIVWVWNKGFIYQGHRWSGTCDLSCSPGIILEDLARTCNHIEGGDREVRIGETSLPQYLNWWHGSMQISKPSFSVCTYLEWAVRGTVWRCFYLLSWWLLHVTTARFFLFCEGIGQGKLIQGSGLHLRGALLPFRENEVDNKLKKWGWKQYRPASNGPRNAV